MRWNMQNLSDKDLDDLFKKAAEHSEADSALPDWQDMVGKLDEAKRYETALIFRNVGGGVAGLLVIAFIVWLGVKSLNDSSEHNYHTENSIQNDNSNSLESFESKIEENFVGKKNSWLEEKSTNQVNNKGVINSAASHGHVIISEKGKINFHGNAIPFSSDEVLRHNIADSLENIQNRGTPIMQSEYTAINDTLLRADSSPEDELIISESKSPDQVPVNRFINRFSVKLAISPDYSTVYSSSPKSIGFNFGMLTDYQLHKNVSITTGLIRSKKVYSATNIAYNGYATDRVDGDCKMWDIPIILYYHFTSNTTLSFYSGVGLSSYIMQQEDYIYYVEKPYSTYTYYQSIRGENNEWFSVVNLSIGMQKRISQRFALQLEPFYKAPLKGVGHGNVSLASIGAFINVKYSFINQ